MKFELTAKNITKIAIVAGVYVALTIFLAPISYGPIQFRVSEVLNLLVFINPIFGFGLVLGCFISNLFSPLGIVDVIFGTAATLGSVILIAKTNKLWIASLWPVIINGIVIGLELQYLFQVPFFIGAAQVAFGEFVVVSIIGVPLFMYLSKNKVFLNYMR